MATNLNEGDAVYVPCTRVDALADFGVALYRTEIVEVGVKKVRIQLPEGVASEWIGKSVVHREVGLLVLNIGDFSSESTLLDPLAKSVTQFCRLLVPDDQVRSLKIRSLQELKTFWAAEQGAYSHVVWIGHGSSVGIRFGVDDWIDAAQLGEALKVHGALRKVYVSLCCKSGYKSVGSVLSKTTICSNFIGPFHSVQGAVASQFCQTFLTSHLLDGKTVGVAFNKARQAVPGGVSFRLWKAGKLKAGQQ